MAGELVAMAGGALSVGAAVADPWAGGGATGGAACAGPKEAPPAAPAYP